MITWRSKDCFGKIYLDFTLVGNALDVFKEELSSKRVKKMGKARTSGAQGVE